jgi:hypothetical protein
MKEQKQRRITGVCSLCGDIPDLIVTRYFEGLQKVERYTSPCLEKEKTKYYSTEYYFG